MRTGEFNLSFGCLFASNSSAIFREGMTHRNQFRTSWVNIITLFDACFGDACYVLIWKSHHLQTVFDFVQMDFGPNNGQSIVV